MNRGIVSLDGVKACRKTKMNKQLNIWWKKLPTEVKYYIYCAFKSEAEKIHDEGGFDK